MSNPLPWKGGPKIDEQWLAAVDRLLIEGMRLGPTAKRNAVNKVLERVPEWTRGDCWRRLRQLRRLPEFAAKATADQPEAQPVPAQPRRRGATRGWTTEDKDHLLDWTGYESAKRIAQRLGRSEEAVRFHMGALGMSAKVTDGWSLRSLRKELRISWKRLRFLIGTGQLRVRDSRVTAASFAAWFESQRAGLDAGAEERFAAAREKGEEGYTWERAAAILGVEVERVQSLICAGSLRVLDPFVTDRQFEEFCKKHGSEINLALLDRDTARWLVDDYGVPKPTAVEPTPRSRKHIQTVRACKCGKKIAGNAYFRHVKSCEIANRAPAPRPPNGGARRPWT